MKRSSHILCFLIPVVFAMSVPAVASAEHLNVEQVSFPVVLSDGNAYSIAGELYESSGHRQRTLQVLVHGAAYDHRYWDVPVINGHEYSYARHMAHEGYAVLAIDQLGTGESDHPSGDFLTLDEAASGLHQVLGALRQHGNRNPIHRQFDRIIVVGHSLGSATAVAAEAAYHDADGLVLTGLELAPHPPPVDSAILGPLLQTPYVSFPSALRAQLFFHSPACDPAVLAYDNDILATTVPRAEFLTGLMRSSDPVALGAALITAPVLVQLGQYDVTAPPSFAANEAAYYPNASSVTVKTVPDAGHALNLHESNYRGWRQIEEWIDREQCHD